MMMISLDELLNVYMYYQNARYEDDITQLSNNVQFVVLIRSTIWR